MRTMPEITNRSRTMKPERRRSPRKKLDQVVYIDFEPSNGGIVTDISQGGLGFHAVGPIEQAGPIRFRLSLGAGDRIEAIGELAWTDETKKVGGLRFTDLPESTREQNRNNEIQSPMPITSGSAFAGPIAAPNESPAFLPVEPDEEEVPASHAPRPHDAASAQKRAPTIILSQFGLASPEPEPMGESISAAWPDPPPRPQFLRGVITGILVSVFLATAFLYYTHPREVSQSLIRLGESVAPQTRPQTPAPTPVPASNRSPADAASVDKAKTEGASTQETKSDMASPAPAATTAPNRSPADAASADKRKTKTTPIGPTLNPALPARAGHGPRTSQSESSGESELTVAQQYLRGTHGRRDTTTGARWLWAAVTHGSATAEVLLADLYRRGDGVPKSCEQARVLLVAASRRGHDEAMQKLRQLNRYGCP